MDITLPLISKRELSVSSGSGKTLETTPAKMLPPSGGVKRANRERRVASVSGSLSVIRQVISSLYLCLPLRVFAFSASLDNMYCQVLTIHFYRA